MLGALRLSYRPGVGMADAFAGWMDGLLGGRETVAAPDARTQDAYAWLTNFIDTINANMPPNLDADAVANCFAEDCVHVQPLR